MYYFMQTFYYSKHLEFRVIKFIMFYFYIIEDLNIYTLLHYYLNDHYQNCNHLPLLTYHTSCLFSIIHIIEMLLFHLLSFLVEILNELNAQFTDLIFLSEHKILK